MPDILSDLQNKVVKALNEVPDVLVFSVGAAIVGTIFFVSLIELFVTVRRRKANEQLRQKLNELKSNYTESVNKLVLEGDNKVEEAEKKIDELNQAITKDKTILEKEYKEKIEEITEKNRHSLDIAKRKAKKLQEEARQKADDYLRERKKEVEDELMNLVISVSKRVLPEGISYDAHKELVMQALRDVKSEGAETQPK